MHGILHIHSENSLNESPLFIDDILSKAKDLGYEAAVLTDDFNMTGTAEFIKKAKYAGIKPVPGVELRIKDELGITTIVLMAKDHTGYIGLCKAVSEENRTFEEGAPVLPWKKMKDIIGKGTPYRGHIYASSSDYKGVLGRIAAWNVARRKESEDLRKMAEGETEKAVEKKQRPVPDREAIEKLKKEIKGEEEKKKLLSEKTEKNFSRKEADLLKIKDPDEVKERKKSLEAEKEESLRAEGELRKTGARLTRLKKKLRTLEEKEKEEAGKRKKAEDLLKKADAVEKEKKDPEKIVEELCGKIRECREIFGDMFFVELMFHGKEEEAAGIPYLISAAEKTGTKTVISNDVHILGKTEDDILRWEIARTLKDNKWRDVGPQAGQYRMKSEQELADMMEGLVPEEVVRRSFENMSELFDSCSFKWPEERHYPKYDLPDGMTADRLLEKKARENIPAVFKDKKWDERYEERLKEELPVISKTGYSDYTLIIADIIREGRDIRHDGEISDCIGPGRGSGAGSLVNYLMGITKVDPIENDLFFERYLNIERVSPPDIDSDIATSVRPLMVKYITEKYGRKPGRPGVCTITTKSRLTSKAAVKAAGRALSAKTYGNAAKLFPVSDRISKAVPVVDKKSVPIRDCAEELAEKFPDETCREIIHYAVLIEGLLSAYGTHAAGMIISDSGDVTDYAPVINIGTQEEPAWNIQFDKEESEEIGLLKLDMLGLTTLDIITNTLKRIYRTRGIKVDIDSIPFEKEVFSGIYGKGDTIGVFQCESEGMRKMWMELQPDRIDDIIAGVALYRPGPMDSIPDYIRNKKRPDEITYLTGKLKPILSSTYGIIVYQEQVMRIVRDLGGFSMGRSDLVRRAMAKKKQAIMDKERKNFVYGNAAEGICGCIANGIPEGTADKIYDMMISFASYAFNKSHAAAYALVSYQSAWLKYHYTKEYLIEAMQQQKTEDIPLFINECRKKGYQVICPDVNLSAAGFTEKGGKIIYGLGNVKGVKNYSASILQHRDRYYKNLADFIWRSGANRTAVTALIKGGAFDRLHPSRDAMLEKEDLLYTRVRRIRVLDERIEEKKKRYTADGASEKTKARLAVQIKQDEAARQDASDDIMEVVKELGYRREDGSRSGMEKEVLYTYISAHPLDAFQTALSQLDPIASAEEGTGIRAGGMASGLRISKTKSGREMSSFFLEDRTGTVKVILWPDRFEKMGEIPRENSILKVYGKLKRDNEGELYIDPSWIGELENSMPQCIIMVKDREEIPRILDGEIKQHLGRQGSRVLFYDKRTGLIEKTGYRVPYGYEQEGLEMTYARSLLPESAGKETGGKDRG